MLFKINKNLFFSSVILYMFSFSVLIPKIIMGGISWGLDDFLAACVLILFLFSPSKWLLFQGYALFLLWILVILQGIICGLISSIQYMDVISFPTEMWQYFKRMAFFYVSANFAFNNQISSEKFYKALIISISCAGIIGLIQVINWGGLGTVFANIYMRSDHQLEMLVNREIDNLRVYGVAGHPNAWGGFATFSAVLSFSGILLRDRTRNNRRMFYNSLLILVFFLSIFNVIFSGSRCSIVSLFVGLFFLLIFSLIYSWNNIIKTMPGILFLLLIGLFSVNILLSNRINFFLYRFDSLYESTILDTVAFGRMNQVNVSLGLLNNFTSFLLGVGNVTQRTFGVSFGTEVEPVYLLVNYGILGAMLRYMILTVVFLYAYRMYKTSISVDRSLALATMGSIVGYLVFSVGYFFFQELYVGAFPWLLFGWVTGKYYLNKINFKI